MTSFQDIDSGGFYHCVSPAYPTTIHLIHRERLLSGKMNYKLCQACSTHTQKAQTHAWRRQSGVMSERGRAIGERGAIQCYRNFIDLRSFFGQSMTAERRIYVSKAWKDVEAAKQFKFAKKNYSRFFLSALCAFLAHPNMAFFPCRL